MNGKTFDVQSIVAGLLRPSAAGGTRATLLVRLAVGGVFVSSGAVKLLFENQGAGRFAKIGLPDPAHLATFVGAIEIVCGALIVVGLFARLSALPLVVDMLVAIATTKVPLLVGPGPEPVAAAPKVGFWAFAYQARLDSAMLLGCVFLVATGAGLWSLDAWRAKRREAASAKDAVGNEGSSEGPAEGPEAVTT